MVRDVGLTEVFGGIFVIGIIGKLENITIF